MTLKIVPTNIILKQKLVKAEKAQTFKVDLKIQKNVQFFELEINSRSNLKKKSKIKTLGDKQESDVADVGLNKKTREFLNEKK